MSKKLLNLLFFITLLGGFLRFYNLGTVNLGFFRDEAALGLNSWSILQTGADEYGQKFPIVFRSFEVFFMPAYVYLSVPFFWLFGLSEFSTRALAALSGTLLIPVGYLIAKHIFNSKKVGLLTAFLVSISPWAIFYSRGGFEGNLALLFFSVGVYLWILFYENKRNIYFLISIFSFVLAMYSYQAPRFVAPLFVGISILLHTKWYKNIKLWVLGAIFAIVLYIPIVNLTTSAAGYHRAFGVSIFSSQNPASIREISSLYLHYFSPTNLFWNGDYNLQRNIPGFSTLYWWLLPLLFFGIFAYLKNIKANKKYLFLAVWMFLGPIPAALTRDPFHTYRSLLMYLPLTMIIANGGVYIADSYRNLKKIFIAAILLLSLYSVCSFMFSIFKIAPVLRSSEWDYGYREIAEVVKTQPSSLRIIVDDDFTEAYIHFLFYRVFSLQEYQQFVNPLVSQQYYSATEVLRPDKFNRFEFRKVDWPAERGDENTIFVFPAKRLPPSEFATDPKLHLIHTVYYPGGEPAFYLIRR